MSEEEVKNYLIALEKEKVNGKIRLNQVMKKKKLS
jgi:hypothetical protein